MGKNFKIPARWRDYTDVGGQVAGTYFLPFKVPLKEAILSRNSIHSDEWFSPSILLEKVPNLKLIIDLTNTDRYYDIQDFTKVGIHHEKINCEGRGLIPSQRIMDKFYAAVDRFIARYGSEYIIGVHCTHGLNRTGYFICKYMVTRMGIVPEQAIENFQNARGHQMYRLNLIQNILKLEDDITHNNFQHRPEQSTAEITPEIENWRIRPFEGNEPRYFNSNMRRTGSSRTSRGRSAQAQAQRQAQDPNRNRRRYRDRRSNYRESNDVQQYSSYSNDSGTNSQ